MSNQRALIGSSRFIKDDLGLEDTILLGQLSVLFRKRRRHDEQGPGSASHAARRKKRTLPFS